MNIIKTNGSLQASFSDHELTTMIVSKFFANLADGLNRKEYSIDKINDYIKKLADKSVDTTEYEYLTAVLELKHQFDDNCRFNFKLKDSFNLKKDTIKNIDELNKFKIDPPDVIVDFKDNLYEFELKRYRDELDLDHLFVFIKNKILDHYSIKANYFIILQPKPFVKFDFNIFKELAKKITDENKDLGIISLSMNNNNTEMITTQLFPEFKSWKRPYENEAIEISEMLHNFS